MGMIVLLIERDAVSCSFSSRRPTMKTLEAPFASSVRAIVRPSPVEGCVSAYRTYFQIYERNRVAVWRTDDNAFHIKGSISSRSLTTSSPGHNSNASLDGEQFRSLQVRHGDDEPLSALPITECNIRYDELGALISTENDGG
jgi:hypothetical protein